RNYQLSSTSLALNAGTDLTSATSPVTIDILGVSRPQGGTFDIGAYEPIVSTINASSLSLNSTSDICVLNGGTLNIDANIVVKSVIEGPGAKLTLNTGNTITTGSLTLQSNSSGTATFVDNTTNGGLTVTGTTTVQQYLPTARNWYISSPVSGATTPSGYTVFQYNEPGDNQDLSVLNSTAYWKGLAQGSSFTVGRGYIALPSSGPVTLNYTGTLNNGTVTTAALTRTTNASKLGFNLVGNPYCSYLNLATLDTTANIWGSYWLRTRNSGNTAYAFDTYNLTSALGTFLSGKPATSYIPPMQSFWVRVKQGGGSPTISFTNTMRSHINNANNVFRAPSANQQTQQVLYLDVTNGENMDQTILAFNPNASNGLDAYDSPKMSNGSASIPEIFTSVGSDQLAINGMNSIPYDTEIPIGFTTGTAGTFSIKASQLSNFENGTKIILKDYQDSNNPVITSLSDGSSYTFSSVVTTNNSSRFALIFKAPSSTTGINPETINNLWFSTQNGQIMINGVNGNGARLEVYNAVGQKVFLGNLTSSNTPLNTKFAAGTYLVKLSSNGYSLTKKIVID
ncbi:MAG: T9SS type A sorting domain-containing protein, partial [Mariniphaga sp.]